MDKWSHDIGQQNSKCNDDRPRCRQGTSAARLGQLAGVDWLHHPAHADADPGHEASGHGPGVRGKRGQEDPAQTVGQTGEEHGGLAAQAIAQQPRQDPTQHLANSQGGG